MNLEYILARLVRKFTPGFIIDFLMRKEIIIKPGLETSNPEMAFLAYSTILNKQGISLKGKKCLLFGYGGNLGLGCILLANGASHVILVDKYAHLNTKLNRYLLPKYKDYLEEYANEIIPLSDYMTLHHADIKEMSLSDIDVVLSMSVLEHVDDIEKTTRALSLLTGSGGIQIHFIDLRDHFFKYPFEMLCYSEKIWHTWLNPPSYLNRYRIHDYKKIFATHFTEIEITILEKNIKAFQATYSRIRKEFLTDNEEDTATSILIVAKNLGHSG